MSNRKMDINWETVILAYFNDIIVVAETKKEVVWTTEKLLKESMSMGVCINENKTKYMMMLRNNLNTNSLLVGDMKYEVVDNFTWE